MEPNVYGGTVLARAGNKTLERVDGRLVVSDGTLTDWIVEYPPECSRRWAQDGVLYIPKKLRTKLDAETAMETYQVTFTDTFAGELNYCFADRYTVQAKSARHALTLAKKERYFSPVPRHSVVYDDGDTLDFRFSGACIGGTVEWQEPEC